VARTDAYLTALGALLPEPLGAMLAPHARIVSLRAGQIVIGQQDRSTDVFVVIEGGLRVELHSLAGRDVFLADVAPGGLFGEFAALDGQPRSASVTAVSKSVLACIPGAVFREVVFSTPATAEWMARWLVGHVRLLTERVFELKALAVRSRLHCELLRLCLDAGVAGNRAAITPAPTHAELANRIGSHREAVTRELLYLQAEGIVERSGRSLAVADVAQLAEIVRAAAGDVDLLQRALEAQAGGAE
jgi:CRP-like cAMP-binding protein